MTTLTLAQARRVAIAAQGLAGTGSQQRSAGTVGAGHLQRVVDRIGLLQIDSVNVLARAHQLPLYSRLGPYDVGVLDRATRGTAARPRRLMESWAHVAAYVPPSTFQLLRFRMRRNREGGFAARVRERHPDVYDHVVGVVADAGPITATRMHALLGHERGPKESWGWNWSIAKQVLEACFFTGELAVAHRTPAFERAYDLTERVLPPGLRDVPELPQPEAAVDLVEIAARALGVATTRCLADYFRMAVADVDAAVAELVRRGRLRQAQVTGWDRTVYLHADAVVPRRTAARTLLAPFDPMVFERRRLAELFGMHYRIGIYTPAAKRTDGYYVLPFLLGESFAGKTDLKADRATGTLVVRTAFVHDDPAGPTAHRPADRQHVADELASELAVCATWLGLDRIDVAAEAYGDLVDQVRRAL